MSNEDFEKQLIEWRHYFHMYPETAFEETNTSDVMIKGDTRSYASEVQKLLEERMQIISERICKVNGAECKFEYTHEFSPTVNSAKCVDIAVRAARNVVGENNVDGNCEQWMAPEDFGTFLQKIPGCLIFIGNGNDSDGNGGSFPNGFKMFILSFTAVAFVFYGVELVGITAAETENPKKPIPTAINSIFWRVLIFYIGALFVMLSLYPWSEIGVNGSPFVLVFAKVGIPAAASVINFAVLTAAFSSMNSDLYVSRRIIYSMALESNAPKLFSKISKCGSPYVGVLISCGLTTIAVILNYYVPDKVFEYIMSISTFAVLICWATIICTQIKRCTLLGHVSYKNIFRREK
ncbi:amino acid permease [Clostridium sp. HV4-5-A1G]|uniref:amino acid permease n=1 Tax=Clostridium sp. HV4-5-A1G TaxID=2004595 RepID=UPI00168290FD|nr:amino acid permease [Clostridium sp. HV4-5-A1G]